MSHQPEAILESNLVKQLTELGYGRVKIHDEESLLSNLKNQQHLAPAFPHKSASVAVFSAFAKEKEKPVR